MKIYERVVLDADGNIVEEISYEYHGPVADCKGGPTKEQKDAQEKSYQLQKEMFDYQKEQAEELEKGKEAEEAKKAAMEQRLIDVKRHGRSSTIHTIARKEGFGSFYAKFSEKEPVPDDPVAKKAHKEKAVREYDKTLPFARKDLGSPNVKKKRLYGN